MNSENERIINVLESHGLTHRRFYQIKPSKTKCLSKEENRKYPSLTSFFLTAFLPHDYPNSVSEDYIHYQFWDSIQAFASSITGGVCTHAILKGVGVGDENASPIAATITWLLKDGMAMVGKIGFVWLQGTRLDSDCKRWRLFADVLNDLAMLLDLISAYFKNHFMLIICTSGIMKSLVGVAGGCTRAALTQHQARMNNLADVSAKDGSQETVVNLVALLCSLVILPIVTESIVLTWILYFTMTAIHLSANYCAVRSVVMETFNEARFEIFTNHYLKQDTAKRNLLTVADVNKRENLLINNWLSTVKVKLGSSFTNIIHGRSSAQVRDMLQLYKDSGYLLRVFKKNSKTVIYVTFNKNVTALTEIEALYQACFIKHLLKHSHSSLKEDLFETNLEVASRKHILKTFNDFKKSLEAMKFKTDTVIFNLDLWRAEW